MSFASIINIYTHNNFLRWTYFGPTKFVMNAKTKIVPSIVSYYFLKGYFLENLKM